MADLLQSVCVMLLLQVAYGGSHGSPASFTATNFVKYYQSTTSFAVSGSVSVVQYAAAGNTPGQQVTWNLAGIDPACAGTESGNICGIHIHVGTSCTEDAGGHYHNMTTDPWVKGAVTGVYYNGASDGKSVMATATNVITNLTDANIEGKVIVVHDSTAPGQRIACAVLTRDPPKTQPTKPSVPGASFTATKFVKYYQSTTSFAVSGSVSVVQYAAAGNIPGQQVTWNLAGIDPACAGTESGNICGIHIHTETSCTVAAGGHYYNSATDPWVKGTVTGVYYNGASDGKSVMATATNVISNLTDSDIEGKVIIVHDSTAPGQRIACAVLTRDPSSPNQVSASHVLGISLLFTTFLAASAL